MDGKCSTVAKHLVGTVFFILVHLKSMRSMFYLIFIYRRSFRKYAKRFAAKGLPVTIVHVYFRTMKVETTYFNIDDDAIKVRVFILVDDEAVNLL